LKKKELELLDKPDYKDGDDQESLKDVQMDTAI
jgi:hypothetical protein